MVDAAVHVNDTMETARTIAKDLFQKGTTADAVIAIYDRIERERERLVVEAERARSRDGEE